MEDQNENGFDLRLVDSHFQNCLLPDEDIDLQEYITAYDNLNKLFPLLGRVFGFVQSDVADKIRILHEYLKGPDKEAYKTVKSMMEYEMKQETVALIHPPSGSRTLLRLHRALQFVVKLCSGIESADVNDKMAPVCRISYDTTLKEFHPWIVQKGVHIACYALPHRAQLVEIIAGGKVDAQVANQTMRQLVTSGETVYQKTQTLFAQKELLALP